MSFVPSAPLGVNSVIYVTASATGITDLAGNPLYSGNFYFTVGSLADATGPLVLGESPVNGWAGLPLNTQVVVGFDRPIDTLTAAQVTLSAGGQAVAATVSYGSGDTQVILTPVALLQPSTVYTINVGAVADLAGHVVSAPVTSTLPPAPG